MNRFIALLCKYKTLQPEDTHCTIKRHFFGRTQSPDTNNLHVQYLQYHIQSGRGGPCDVFNALRQTLRRAKPCSILAMSKPRGKGRPYHSAEKRALLVRETDSSKFTSSRPFGRGGKSPRYVQNGYQQQNRRATDPHRGFSQYPCCFHVEFSSVTHAEIKCRHPLRLL